MSGQARQDPAFDLVHLPQAEACGQLVSGLPSGRTPASRSQVPIPNGGFWCAHLGDEYLPEPGGGGMCAEGYSTILGDGHLPEQSLPGRMTDHIVVSFARSFVSHKQPQGAALPRHSE